MPMAMNIGSQAAALLDAWLVGVSALTGGQDVSMMWLVQWVAKQQILFVDLFQLLFFLIA